MHSSLDIFCNLYELLGVRAEFIRKKKLFLSSVIYNSCILFQTVKEAIMDYEKKFVVLHV